jgi:transcriptional regulator with XRE-family HTH domain
MGRSTTSRRRAAEQSAKIGSEVKLARVTLAMTARQVADRAGVSSSTEARVELGDPGLTVGTMCAVAEAVGLDVVIRAYNGRAPSLRDTGQIEAANQLRSWAHPSWQPDVELLIGPHGESIDMAFFGTTEIWAFEIERMATDFQAQYRRADRKREALAARHQRPVRLVLAIEDTRRNRAALEPHLAFIRSVMPAGTREVLGCLRTGKPLGRDGLIWIRRPPRVR